MWSGYAASQSDATALMNGASTPLQVGGGASAWWPLGGGTTGASPSLSDVWLADATGNGNTLSLVSGSLANAQYAGAIVVQSPVTVAPHVTKCGRLAMFGSIAAAPAANGVHPHQPITAVTGTPTVYRNGVAVGLGPATWFNESLDSPIRGLHAPVRVGRSDRDHERRLRLHRHALGGVVRRRRLGSGARHAHDGQRRDELHGDGGRVRLLDRPDRHDHRHGRSGIGRGRVRDRDRAASIVGYWVANGGSGYSSPTVAVSGAGSGATATATLSGGVITAINAVTCGKNYHNPPTVTVAAPSGSSGATGNITAQAIAVVSPTGTVVAVLPICAGLMGCGSGYSSGSPPSVAISGAGGTGATATATVSSYIESIPVISPGSGFTSLPTITISGGSGTGADGRAHHDRRIGRRHPDLLGAGRLVHDGPRRPGGRDERRDGQLDRPARRADQRHDRLPGHADDAARGLGRRAAGRRITPRTSPPRTDASRGTPWIAVGTGTLTTGSNGFPVSWTNPTATYRPAVRSTTRTPTTAWTA